ncbi:MAG: DASS family sodium-coupled anion symporter [Eubacteriales bacterium]|nr:DASS family sodium-coupled anion symporter [Bacillota bacterium]MBV1727786.1 DASS family sodium-coupled anion symporter [Desulforudis sp.]MDP3050757.1 DASS family sodium-coupled anion symporter [Eubacteriales bacterium]MDQ7789369.1 DASS family sodium-coupled anion symporter [Clostridia bacterium]MDZ4042431.1 DASS family sodium-coupled anion symporter [Eubacteriales bacterium]
MAEVELQGSGPSLQKRLMLICVSVFVGIAIFMLPTPAGLSETGHMYLALLAALLIMFLTEPVPLPIVMVISGISLIVFGIGETRAVWAGYAHPVVFFVLGCLMVAIVAESVGLTDRLGRFILRYTGTNVIRFSFISCLGLGVSSAFMHDIAACAIGIMAMLPLMKAAGINVGSRTGAFLMISLPFCCSAGGMGTLVGGGRNMVSAAFLQDLTGIEITFLDWMIYAFPACLVAVPAVWFACFLVFRPDRTICFIDLTEEQKAKKPFTVDELKALAVVALVFVGFFTKNLHGQDYSIIVMGGIVLMVLIGLVDWRILNAKTEWAVAVLVFGGGIALGTAMGTSGAAEYLASVFFPFFEGKGWLALLIGVGVFAAIMTNLMANIAAAALILPIAIPLAIMEGVDPTIVAMAMGMWTSFAYLLVIGCPPNVVSYSFGYFKSSQLTKAGLVAMPVGMAVLILCALTWWKIIGLV